MDTKMADNNAGACDDSGYYQQLQQQEDHLLGDKHHEQRQHQHHIKRITSPVTFCPAYHLGIGFFLIFAALMPTQNLLTSLNGTLGYYSIAVLYFCMACFGPAAPFVVTYFKGPKGAIVAGAIAYLIFQVANVLIAIKAIPSTVGYFIMLPPSALLGMGACLLWTAEGLYASRVSQSVDSYLASSETRINEADSRNDKEHSTAPRNSLGFVNGLVLVFLQLANLVMNLASSALLSSGIAPIVLFIVLAAMSGAGCLAVITLPPTPSPIGYVEDYEGGTLLSSFKDIGVLHKDKKLLAFMTLFVTCGFNQGYLWSTLTGDIITPALGEEWIGYVMATSAAVDALGSYAFGQLSDKIGRSPILFAGVVVNLIPCLMISVIGVPNDGYGYIFTWASLLGIADAVWMTITSALIAENFLSPHCTSAFASFTMWRSFTTALMSLLGPFVPLQIRTAILGASVTLTGVVRIGILCKG